MKQRGITRSVEAQKIVRWIQSLKETTGLKSAIIGISGGKDSTVCGMLLCEALGRENVYGLLMPNGNQTDLQDAITVVDKLGIANLEINIADIYKQFVEVSIDVTDEARANVAPRIRNTMLYLLGQSVGARVCGTGNASELLVGYFTKWADTSADFAPLANLTTEEVVDVGLQLCDKYDIPEELITKTPTDGIWGVSDEEKMGVSYIDINNYIYDNKSEIDYKVLAKIERMIEKSRHKKESVPTYTL